MKKLINDVETVVGEMLDGMVAAYPDSVRRLPNTQVLVRNDAPVDDKVAVVSAGVAATNRHTPAISAKGCWTVRRRGKCSPPRRPTNSKR
jgi:hypothetical protein